MDFEAITDPLVVVDSWRKQAEASERPLPDAMTLSTIGLDGAPRSRVVLFKGRYNDSIWFFTNYESDKGRELTRDPRAALLVHYPVEALQARLTGTVTKLTEAQSDDYFMTRPRLSQIGAWASHQSQTLGSRVELEQRVREVEATYAGKDVPRPAYWGGYALLVTSCELWVGQSGRLHERARFTRDTSEGSSWHCQRLWP